MKKLICVYCGKKFIVSKFCKRSAYDYECPDCLSKRKRATDENANSSKNNTRVGERCITKLYHKRRR